MSDSTQQPNKTPGHFSWNEIITRDVAASTKFYTELFGWTAQTIPMGPGFDYTMLSAGGTQVAGMLPTPPQAAGAPTAWMGYVTVSNLQESVAKARALGAHVCKDITPLPMGSFAIVADPQGAVIGLWEFSKA